MIAYLSVGDHETARTLFGWAQLLRDEDGHYWTGIVFPEMVHFPGGEKSTYTVGLDRAGRRRPGRHLAGLGPLRRPRPAPRAGPDDAEGAVDNARRD